MANNEVGFSVNADIRPAKKSLNEIVSTASKLANKIQDALNVSSVESATAEVKKLREEMGATAKEIGTAKKAFYAFNLESGRAKSLKNQIRDVTNDPERKKLKRSLYSDRSRLKKLDQNSPDDADKVNKLNAKIAETEKALEPYEQKIESLKTKLDGVNERLAKMPKAAKAFISEYSHAGEVADKILNSVNGVNASTEELAGKANKANSGFEGTKTAADGAAKAVEGLVEKENKANTPTNDRAEAVKQEDASLRELLATLSDYQTELEAARQSGQDLTDIEQRIAGVTDQINQKFQFSEAGDSISSLTRRLLELQSAKREIERAGMPVQFGAQYDQIVVEIENVKAAISDYKRSLNGVSATHEKTAKSSRKLLSSLPKIKSGFNSVGKAANKVKSSFESMARNMRSNFKHLISNLTKYVFGFRSLFFLIRRLRSGVKEGLQNLVKFNGGANDVNSAVSALMSSLLFLKNAWAAAFSPIITYVMPVLTRLIDFIAEVGNAIARFIATLTGQATVFQAVKVDAGDYAKSLDGVGGSAGGAAKKTKQLTDRLAAFDDLNVLGKDKDPSGTGSGGGGGSGDKSALDPNEMFKIIPTGDTLADMVLNAWKNADFTELGELLKNKIIEALPSEEDWKEIQGVASKIGSSAGTFLAGLFGDPELFTEAGRTIGEGLNTITAAATAFLDATEGVDFGGNLAKGINNLLHTTDWSQAGKNIGKALDQITTNIQSFIDNLDADEVSSAISEFISGLDIPKILSKMGKNALTFTVKSIKITAKVIEQLGEDLGEKLVVYVDKDRFIQFNEPGGTIEVPYTPTFDWKENPIKAWFEAFEFDLGEFIVVDIYGIDTIDELIAAYKAWKDVGDKWNGFWKDVKDDWKDVFDDLKEDWNDFWEDLEEGWKDFKDGWNSFWQGLSKVYNLAHDFSDLDLDFLDESKGTGGLFDLIFGNDRKFVGNTHRNNSTTRNRANFSNLFGDLLDERTNRVFVANAHNRHGRGENRYTKSNPNEKAPNVKGAFGSLKGEGNEAVVSLTDVKEKIFEIFGDIKEKIFETWENIKSYLPQTAEEIKVTISEKWEDIKTNTQTKWENIKNIPGEKFRAAKERVISVIEDLKLRIGTTWGHIKDSTEKSFAKLKDGIIGPFLKAKEAIKAPINGIISVVERFINGIIRGLNKLSDKFNEISGDLGDVAKKVGLPTVTMPTLSTISIPRLAQGAVIPPNKEFMAILGDQTSGTNIEAPLDVIKQAVAEELSAQLEVLQDGFNSVVTAINNKNLNIGDKEIGKANARYLNQQRLIRGTSI